MSECVVFVPGAAHTSASVLKVNDVITTVEGETVELADQIGPIVAGRQVGDVIVLGVKRGGDLLDLDVTLTGREDDPAVPMIGITAVALGRAHVHTGDHGTPGP